MAGKQQAQNQPHPAQRRVANYYRYFGVRPDASSDEIVEAYLGKIDGADPATIQRADRALAVLTDPQKRALHDQELAAAKGSTAPGASARAHGGPVRVTPEHAAGSSGKRGLWALAAVAVLVAVGGFFLFTIGRQPAPLSGPELEAQAIAAQLSADGVQTLDLVVNGDTMSYRPSVIKVKQGVPVRFNLSTEGRDPG